MIYYLKIAGVGVKVVCPNNLYLFDEWKIFFEEGWGKQYVTNETKANLEVIMNGLKTKNMKIIKSTIPVKDVPLPVLKKNRLYFDNLLNGAYLISLLRKMIVKEIFEEGGVLMHASGVVFEKKAIMVMGKSGSGKTTMLRKLMAGGYQPLAEDDVWVKRDKVNKKIMACPVIFSNKVKLHYSSGECYEIAMIVTIKKDSPLRFRKMSDKDGLMFILDQVKGAMNSKARGVLVMEYAKYLGNKVYTLECCMDDKIEDIVGLIRNEISN